MVPAVDLGGGFAYVRVQELPTDAIGPGGLGTGAFYFASSGLPYSYQVFLTELTVSAHTADRRRSLTVGRMPYTSGAEGETCVSASSTAGSRAAAGDSTDGSIGTFDWSLLPASVRRRTRRVDAAIAAMAGGGLFLVTQGGYEESANLTMNKLLVGRPTRGIVAGRPARALVTS